MENTCRNCAYYEYNRCHRFPPQNTARNGGSPKIQFGFEFPEVNQYDWCGEFKAIEAMSKEG